MRIQAFSIPRRRWFSYHQVPPPASAWPISQLPLNALSPNGALSDEQGDYEQNIYVHHLINAATAFANAAGKDVDSNRNLVQDISVGFRPGRLRLNVYCKEAPGLVVFTEPAAEDEGDLDSLPDGGYGHRTFTENERTHTPISKTATGSAEIATAIYPQLSTLNSRKKLTTTEVRLLAKKLSK